MQVLELGEPTPLGRGVAGAALRGGLRANGAQSQEGEGRASGACGAREEAELQGTKEHQRMIKKEMI